MKREKKVREQVDVGGSSIRLSKGDKVYYVIVNIFVALIMLIVLIPLINIVANSFSKSTAVLSGKVFLWPVDFSVEGYIKVFQYAGIWTAYGNTIFYTLAGTLICIVMTILAAYPLSMKEFPGKGFITFLFTFTMLFGGGMIPTYIQIKNLGIMNTRWALLLPGAISVTNMIICRTFFINIPHDLFEAAEIDGCNEFKYLVKMVLPLSSAVIAVLALYYAVGHWNSYHDAFLYIMKRDLMPLQIILREILIQNTIDSNSLADDATMMAQLGMAELLKYALIIVSSVPVLILYPFIKKFFAKGVMMGSLKG